MSQDINVARDLPYGMDKTYLDTIKPSGILRNWIWSSTANSQGRSNVIHLLNLNMRLKNEQTSQFHDIGEQNIEIVEGTGMKTENNLEAYGKEIAFTFSKSVNAEWKLLQGSDEIRYSTIL